MISHGLTKRWTQFNFHAEQWKLWASNARFRVVPAGRRSGKCLPAGTLVTMADGSERPIELLRRGEFVQTISESTCRSEIWPIEHVHDNGLKPMVEIRTRSRVIRCTTNHPLLMGGAWVEAGAIGPGQMIGVPRSTPFGTASMDADELDMLAIWLAEGKEYTISNGNPAIVAIVKRIARKWGLTPKHHGGVDWYIGGGGRRGGSQAGSKNRLRQMLERLGIWGLRSKTKHIPDLIFTLRRDQVARFLNLFLACDGSLYMRSNRQPTLSVGLANERMTRQVGSLLHKFGITGSFRERRADGFTSWEWHTSRHDHIATFCRDIGMVGFDDSIGLAKSCPESNWGNNVYLPISYEQVHKRLRYKAHRAIAADRGRMLAVDAPPQLSSVLRGWRKQNRNRVSLHRYRQLAPFLDGYFAPMVDGDIVWEEVLSSEHVAAEQTFDLTIKGNHNFVANGLITHNTELAKRYVVIQALDESNHEDAWYACTAPTNQQAKDIYWRHLIDLSPANMVRSINHTELTITYINNVRLRVAGLDKPERIEGPGHLMGVVLDEYANMKKDAWDAHVRPMLTETGGWAWFIGVPEGRNHYYELHNRVVTELLTDNEWEAFSWATEEVLPLYLKPEVAAREIAAAKRDLDPLIYDQEYNASFVTFQGAAYFTFDRKRHAAVPLADRHNPGAELYLCFDFNVDPGVACIVQDVLKRDGDPENWAGTLTAVLDEVYIPRGSNTPLVARTLADKWAEKHPGPILCYGDATGGARHSSQVMGTDWDLVEQELQRRFPARPYLRVPTENPPERVRLNAVNRRFESADGMISMVVDPVNCPKMVRDLEGVTIKEGTNEIDKKSDPSLSHLSDALGYFVHYEHPIADHRAQAQPLLL